jgi:prepilin-type N-terminal cleavage/methylation domain-containing protein/prepilin-type processing-associated H-X9-DG protein
MITRRESTRTGFTLVELLVVIGIIALLIAVLLPVLANVNVKAAQTKSASNMRQIGLAIRMYCEANRGFFPTTEAHDGTSWIFQLQPYLGRTAEGLPIVEGLRINESDPLAEQRRQRRGTSYILNSYICVKPVDPFGEAIPGAPIYNNWNLIRQHATMPIVFDSGSDSVDAGGDHTHSYEWFRVGASPQERWTSILNDVRVDMFATRPNPGRTRGSSNFLYLDAHVEAVPADTVRRWADQNFDFARPRARGAV